MIEQELFNAFDKLDTNEKRNQISLELEKLGYLLDEVHKKLNIEKLPSSIYNYNYVSDSNMSNEEYFSYMYKSIIYIRKDVLTLTNNLIKND